MKRAAAVVVAAALMLGLCPTQHAAAQDGPQIYTPIGTFTIFSATLADEFPVGCNPAPYSVPTCNRGRDGRGLLIIHIRHDAGHDGTDFTKPIEEDIRAVEIVGDDGEEWQMGLRQWSSLDGIRLVYTGRGSPESIVLTWPGNRPITLSTVDSDDPDPEPGAAPAAPEAAPEPEPEPIPQPEATTGEVKGTLVSKSTGEPVQVVLRLMRDREDGEDHEEIQRMMDAIEDGATSGGTFHKLRVPPGFYHLFSYEHGLIGEGFAVEAGEVVDLGVVEVR